MFPNKNVLLAIDGETAAGKGTLAKRIAQENEMYYLGTGQMFRVFGYLVLNNLAADAKEGAEFFANEKARYEWDGQNSKLYVEEEDVTNMLDDDVVAVHTSHLAKDSYQQSQINGIIRDFGLEILSKESMVSEGRNTATALFPEHDMAFYVTADVAVRAQRRFDSHERDGRKISYAKVLEELIARDERDRNRTSNPLKPTPGAILIDTSAVTISEAQNHIQQHINELGE